MRIEIKSTLVETVQEFLKNIKILGGGFFEWYVGITIDPKKSFCILHKVELNNRDWLLSYECPFEVAMFIKKFLISVGCVNSTEFENDLKRDRMVYVYLFRLHKGDELYSII